MNLRYLLLIVSAGAIAIGGLVLAQPALAEHVSVHNILLGILGVGMILLGLARLQRARSVSRPERRTGTPERIIQVASPGGEVDTQMASFDRPRKEYEVTLNALDDRLFRAATQVIKRERACGDEEAAKAIRTGDWTDDPVAAGYFSTETHEVIPTDWRERFRLEVAPDRVRRDRLARTMVALAEEAGIEPEVDDS